MPNCTGSLPTANTIEIVVAARHGSKRWFLTYHNDHADLPAD